MQQDDDGARATPWTIPLEIHLSYHRSSWVGVKPSLEYVTISTKRCKGLRMQPTQVGAVPGRRTAPTDITDPSYFHKVVDCQWACPSHTPVPEYIRLISQGRYAAAYMLNWESNVFPAILGRVCDRPCEPACRRGRV